MTSKTESDYQHLGVVVIGRNEAKRLSGCFEGIPNVGCRVYVDSDSNDSSRDIAAKHGFTVVHLKGETGHSAARARNAGFSEALAQVPGLPYIQFIDGDCELVPTWLSSAYSALEADNGVDIVCGRRKERCPNTSIYNSLTDIEWDTPTGFIASCGGDFMVRSTRFSEVGGFLPELIAGEEPELCLRLRQTGGRILRLEEIMTEHDAHLLSITAWWKRASRAGYAFANLAELHPRDEHFRWRRKCLPAVVWAFILPALLILSVLLGAFSVCLVVVLLYVLQVVRVAHKSRSRVTIPWRYSLFMLISKFSEFQGQANYWYMRLKRRQPSLIEYK